LSETSRKLTGKRPANIPSLAGFGVLSSRGSQQPWQMPFIFAFMIASSSLIVSMYFALSTFDVGAARTTGLAAEDATGGAPLS
jgi:hypothetical protein